MRKLLTLSLLPLLLLNGCKGSTTASDVAHDACVTAMTADPIISALVPGWGQAISDVVSLICAIPAVVNDFQSLPTEQAKAKTESRITSMASVKLPAPAAPAPAVEAVVPPAAQAAPPPAPVTSAAPAPAAVPAKK